MTIQAKYLDITIPRPHPLQFEIIKSQARFKGVLVGRRAGKTMGVGIAILDHFFTRPYAHILYGSASADQTTAIWRYLLTWLRPAIQARQIEVRQSPRLITRGDSLIHIRTASEPDSLRSEGPTLVILDEAAYLPADTWDRAVLPMLGTHQAPAYLVSSPRRGSWLNMLYLEHQQTQPPDWAWWNLPSSSNPFLAKSELAMWQETMTGDAYREEIMAEVLVGSGGVFHNLNNVMTVKPQAPYAGQFVAGIDWGDEGDYTVITILDRAKSAMVAVLRMNKLGPDMQYQKAKAFLSQWKPDTVISEHTHFGLTLNQALRNDGFSITDFATTGKSKPPLIENLVLALERGELALLEDSVLQSELMTFQRVPSATGYQYRATGGAHDDSVMSLAFAWWGLQYSSQSFVPILLE